MKRVQAIYFKRIQNNDGKDARNVYQRSTGTKEQTEMNNTLEGINSRITEAEEWINDLEDRMVETTGIKQNIEKRMKRNEDSQETSGTTLNTPTFTLQGSQKEIRKKKDLRKYLKR